MLLNLGILALSARSFYSAASISIELSSISMLLKCSPCGNYLQ